MATALVTMDIGSGRTVAFNVRQDIVDYFGIVTVDAAAQTPELITRRGFSYVKRGLDGTGTGTNVTVASAQYYKVPGSSGNIIGKAIKIPTGLQTQAGNERFTTIRVPANAVKLAVVKWIYDNFDAARRPPYFITDSGVRVPVRNYTVADVNPGNEEAAGSGDAGGGGGAATP